MVQLLPPEETGRYGCPVCRLRFVSLGEKKLHIRTEHPR